MIRTTLLALSLSVALGCGPGRTTFARHPEAAQAFDTAASDPKAVAVADQVLAAAGGAAAWAKAKQIRWTGAVDKDGAVVLSGEEAWDRWEGRHYGRLAHQGGDIVVIRQIYGDDASAYLARGSQFERLPGDDARNAIKAAVERWRFDTAVLCMQFLLEAPGNHLSYVGEVNDDQGQPTLEQIKVQFDPKDTSRDGTTYFVTVDKQSHVIQRLELVKPGQPDSARIGYKLGEWTESGGLKFPGRLDNLGYKGEVIKLTQIAVSESPDDDLYVAPVQ